MGFGTGANFHHKERLRNVVYFVDRCLRYDSLSGAMCQYIRVIKISTLAPMYMACIGPLASLMQFCH